MSIPFRLLIPRRHYDALLLQAQAELPNECCGFLAGQRAPADVGWVRERYPLVNNAASPREYLASDRTLFEAYRAMRTQGLDLLAIYHSHPLSDPVPSKTDLARNFFTDVMHLIVSLKTDPPVLRAWWLGESDYQEADWQIADEM